MTCKNCHAIKNAKEYYNCTQNEDCLKRLCIVCWAQILNKDGMACYCHVLNKKGLDRPFENVQCYNPSVNMNEFTKYKLEKSLKDQNKNVIIDYLMSSLKPPIEEQEF